MNEFFHDFKMMLQTLFAHVISKVNALTITILNSVIDLAKRIIRDLEEPFQGAKAEGASKGRLKGNYTFVNYPAV